MKTFFKAQFSSLVATLVDFGTTVFLVEALGVTYITGLIIGAIAGAASNFIINRYWSFNVADKPAKKQRYRYGLVWIGSLALNLAGTFLLTELLGIRYIVSRLITAVVVGLTFNYLFQKNYVFSAR